VGFIYLPDVNVCNVGVKYFLENLILYKGIHAINNIKYVTVSMK